MWICRRQGEDDIISVYPQASGFPDQSTEYAFSSVVVSSLGDMVWPCRTALLLLILLFLYIRELCLRSSMYMSFSPCFETSLVLLEFALSRRPSRGQWSQRRAGYSRHFSLSGLRRLCGLSLSILFVNPAIFCGWFSSRVLPILLVSTFAGTL